MLSLKSPVGTNYRVDPNDLMDTKRALSDLGYYDVPAHRGIDDWTDDATFDGIKQFQQDNDLKVDGFMRPGGPMEQKMNSQLAAGEGGDVSQTSGPDRTNPSGKGNGFPTGRPGPSKSDAMLRGQLEGWKLRLQNAKTDWERRAAQLQIDRIQAILDGRS